MASVLHPAESLFRSCHGALFLSVLTLGAIAAPASGQTSRNVTLLAQVDSYGSYSSCCSYVHSDGREYAVIGTNTGTAIYNIVNPSTPALVGFIPGVNSIWREMKQYGDRIYVVSEGGGSGLQIIRMTNPQAPVLATTYLGSFSTAHTVTVDTARGLLYANGANGSTGGMRILSLASPEAPVQIGAYFTHYVHDSHVRGTQLFVASIYDGLEIVLDVTDPANPTEITMWTTPGDFTHNSWTSDNGDYLFTTDENSTGFVTVYDITALPAVTEVAQFTANPNAIAHNVHVKGNIAFVSHYTEGVRLLDVSDPSTPTEIGYYDTWPGASGGFEGDWAVDPFFPSGVFIVSDISTGLYVFQANLDYGIMKGTITEQISGLPAEGAVVTSASTGLSYTTFGLGKYALALDPGQQEIEAIRFGDYPASTNGPIVSGESLVRNIVLTQIPRGTVAGALTGGAGMTPLNGAEIHLHETPLMTESAAGAYELADVPEGPYLLEAERAGYLPKERNVQVVGGATATIDLNLTAMDFYYSVEAAAGWTLSAAGDNATSGLWILDDPIGSGPQAPAPLRPQSLRDRIEPLHHPDGEGGGGPLTIQPENDHTPAPGVKCFVTGNGPVGGAVGAADVDNGITTLTSPSFNLTAVADPHFSFYYWYTNDGGSNPGTDAFLMSISSNGGSSWVPVASILLSNHEWTSYDVRVADFITPTATVRMRFVAQDLGGGSIVEAGVDDFGYYAAPVQSAVPDVDSRPAIAGIIEAGPNPFLVATDLRLSQRAPGNLSVHVFDVNGRQIRRLQDGPAPAEWRMRWDGTDEDGRRVPGGVYFVRARGDGFERTARVIRGR